MLSIFVVVLLAAVQPISCWGSLGHRTVAYLAEKYFTNEASQFVQELLKNDRGFDISDAALFADKIKFRRPATKVWHYIDAQDDPPNSCGVDFKRDCNVNGDPGCIVSAIMNMTSRINDAENSITEQSEALMFLIHFLGDIHQPLHTENMKRGGTHIPACFNGHCSDMNLHSVWDTEIPEMHRGVAHREKPAAEKNTAASWAEDLFKSNRVRGLTISAECRNIRKAQDCALKWANESNSFICSYVLSKLTDEDLGGQYFDGAVPIVDELVGKAGLRLGGWINALAAARSKDATFVVQDL